LINVDLPTLVLPSTPTNPDLKAITYPNVFQVNPVKNRTTLLSCMQKPVSRQRGGKSRNQDPTVLPMPPVVSVRKLGVRHVRGQRMYDGNQWLN